MDKDLKALRNARWDKAFSESASSDTEKEAVNRKATIVIEHLIQASDVAHTMQVRLHVNDQTSHGWHRFVRIVLQTVL